MRYYVHVENEEFAPWFSTGIGEKIREFAIKNLREIRFRTGFDYEGLQMKGIKIDGSPALEIQDVFEELIPNVENPFLTRIIISQNPLIDTTPVDTKLLVHFCEGQTHDWVSGSMNIQSRITIDKNNRIKKLEICLQDVLMDMMIGNCSSITSVIEKYISSGKSHKDFFELKSQYVASQLKDKNVNSSFCFDNYSSTSYASFASLARDNYYKNMNETELSSYSSYWTDFLETKLGQFFLTSEEAANIVRQSKFHPAYEMSGKASQRISHQFMNETKLLAALNNPQIVKKNGTYVLCYLSKRKDGLDGDLAAEFGYSSSKKLKKFKLIPQSLFDGNRPNFKHPIRKLISEGCVVPFRLFLKHQC